MIKPLTIGYSPCPNDTFIFYALIHTKITLSGIKFEPEFLEDVETLNSWALQRRLDVTKLSFHALGHVLDEYTMLGAGAALGRGCGPLLVTQSGRESEDIANWRIAIPGAYTTAAMLLKIYNPLCLDLVVLRFDEIMDALASGKVDGGVIIHESRFTYKERELVCVQDLGEWWEQETGLPIPLGCIAARSSLGKEALSEINAGIRLSLEWARSDPQACQEYIAAHAQELDKTVIASHIELYVNDFSLDIGDAGKEAVSELFARGARAGLFPPVSKANWLIS